MKKVSMDIISLYNLYFLFEFINDFDFLQKKKKVLYLIPGK